MSLPVPQEERCGRPAGDCPAIAGKTNPHERCHIPGPAGVLQGVSTSGEAVRALREAGLSDAPFDFEDLFRTHYGRTTALIARVVRDRARAEELAVDAFLRLWRHPGAQGRGSPAWLMRTALRLGLDELRRETRRARYEPLLRFVRPAPTPEETARTAEDRQRVRLVLSSMRRQHAALLLLRSHGLSYDELAATLDLKSTSVGTLLRRSREAFRKEYVRRYGDT